MGVAVMSIMRLIALPILILATSGALAKKANDSSWGKVGVSLEEFIQDSNECADTSRHVTAYIKPKTIIALNALSSAQLIGTAYDLGMGGGPGSLDNPMSFNSAMTWTKTPDDIARRSQNFGEQYTEVVSSDVRDELQAVVDRCLSERGYVKIRLNADQRRSLSKLKRFSPERTAYLHSIDTDPNVVLRQAFEDGS
jgi:hypothetical protein